MSKLSACVLCVGASLLISGSAFANGGSYHHAEFVPLNSIATTPDPQHGCPYLVYNPTECFGTAIRNPIHRPFER
jgi:hypothetical protein